VHNTSKDPCNTAQVFQGPSAFSEPETRNVRWLLETYPRIRWFVDIHGFKGEVYHPFGDDQNQITTPAMNWRNPAFDHQRGVENDAYREYIAPGDLATHALLAKRLEEGIQPVRGSNYVVTQSFVLYPTAGTSSDYAWSRHLVDWTKPRVEAFAIEHRANGVGLAGFQPPIAEMDEIVSEITSGLVNFCLAASCGVQGLTAEMWTPTSSSTTCRRAHGNRPVILQVTAARPRRFASSAAPRARPGRQASPLASRWERSRSVMSRPQPRGTCSCG
jgi:hypothetical protein